MTTTMTSIFNPIPDPPTGAWVSCTELIECPGPRAQHPSYSVCDCPDCHARGSFGCHPPASARNVAMDGAS